MKRLRRITAWLTLLLFISGVVSPRLFAATRADCPMMQAEQERLCHATPKPEPTKPACCIKHESEISVAGSAPSNCCCGMTAVSERSEAPALLTVVADPVVLPASAAPSPTPGIAAFGLVAPHRVNETAPRGPPRRTSSPRAPPFS